MKRRQERSGREKVSNLGRIDMPVAIPKLELPPLRISACSTVPDDRTKKYKILVLPTVAFYQVLSDNSELVAEHLSITLDAETKPKR